MCTSPNLQLSAHQLTCVSLSLKDGPAVLTAFRINLHYSGTGRSEALCDAWLSVLSSPTAVVSLLTHLLYHHVNSAQ